MSDSLPVQPALPTDWKALMDTLFPDTWHEVKDILGNRYRVRTTLPARREVQLARKLAEVADLPSVDLASALKAAQGGEDIIGTVLGVVKALTTDERVLVLLSEAVAIAHPTLLGQAKAKLDETEDGKEILAGLGGGGELIDLFDVAELVQSLLPFVLRPAAKALGAMGTVGPLLPQGPKT